MDLNSELHDAIAESDDKRVLSALGRGADADHAAADGINPLQRAAFSPRSEHLTCLLLSNGANPCSIAKDGMDAIEWACSRSFWHAACAICSHEDTSIMPRHYFAADKHGACLAAGAATLGHLGALRRLLRSIPEFFSWKNAKGVDAFWLACEAGHERCALLLSEGTSPISNYPDGSTPLHMASKLSSPQALEAILAHGANPSALDDEGRLALHVAAECGRARSCWILGQKNEALYSLDFSGSLPIEKALAFGHSGAHAALFALMERDELESDSTEGGSSGATRI